MIDSSYLENLYLTFVVLHICFSKATMAIATVFRASCYMPQFVI